LRQTVFVDTSAFHALLNTANTQEHQAAKKISEDLQSGGTVLVTTDYVLDETYTLVRSTLGHRVAVRFGWEIQKNDMILVQTDESIQKKAWTVFERYSDKTFSFTDCTSFVVMEEGKIKTAFTFDGHFRQYGFHTLPRKWPAKKR
jgi:predicted nucleic acid-binding protein